MELTAISGSSKYFIFNHFREILFFRDALDHGIPTNPPNVRKDENDVVYRTEEEKWRNVVKEIEARFGVEVAALVAEMHANGGRVLH